MGPSVLLVDSCAWAEEVSPQDLLSWLLQHPLELSEGREIAWMIGCLGMATEATASRLHELLEWRGGDHLQRRRVMEHALVALARLRQLDLGLLDDYRDVATQGYQAALAELVRPAELLDLWPDRVPLVGAPVDLIVPKAFQLFLSGFIEPDVMARQLGQLGERVSSLGANGIATALALHEVCEVGRHIPAIAPACRVAQPGLGQVPRGWVRRAELVEPLIRVGWRTYHRLEPEGFAQVSRVAGLAGLLFADAEPTDATALSSVALNPRVGCGVRRAANFALRRLAPETFDGWREESGLSRHLGLLALGRDVDGGRRTDELRAELAVLGRSSEDVWSRVGASAVRRLLFAPRGTWPVEFPQGSQEFDPGLEDPLSSVWL